MWYGSRSGSIPKSRGCPAWLAWRNTDSCGRREPLPLRGDPWAGKLRCSDPPAALKGPRAQGSPLLASGLALLNKCPGWRQARCSNTSQGTLLARGVGSPEGLQDQLLCCRFMGHTWAAGPAPDLPADASVFSAVFHQTVVRPLLGHRLGKESLHL